MQENFKMLPSDLLKEVLISRAIAEVCIKVILKGNPDDFQKLVRDVVEAYEDNRKRVGFINGAYDDDLISGINELLGIKKYDTTR